MSIVAFGAAVVLALVTAAGLLRVGLGPTEADRMLGIQLLGTSLAALSLVLIAGLQMPRLADLALVIAVLASVTGAAFVSVYASRAGDGQ